MPIHSDGAPHYIWQKFHRMSQYVPKFFFNFFGMNDLKYICIAMKYKQATWMLILFSAQRIKYASLKLQPI